MELWAGSKKVTACPGQLEEAVTGREASLQECGGLCSSEGLPGPTSSNPEQRGWTPALL